jgi:hypothetical protein
LVAQSGIQHFSVGARKSVGTLAVPGRELRVPPQRRTRPPDSCDCAAPALLCRTLGFVPISTQAHAALPGTVSRSRSAHVHRRPGRQQEPAARGMRRRPAGQLARADVLLDPPPRARASGRALVGRAAGTACDRRRGPIVRARPLAHHAMSPPGQRAASRVAPCVPVRAPSPLPMSAAWARTWRHARVRGSEGATGWSKFAARHEERPGERGSIVSLALCVCSRGVPVRPLSATRRVVRRDGARLSLMPLA